MLTSLATARAARDLESTSDTVLLAGILVDAGNKIDLTGLDIEIEQICRDILSLDQVDAQRMAPPLQKLQRDLDALASRFT